MKVLLLVLTIVTLILSSNLIVAKLVINNKENLADTLLVLQQKENKANIQEEVEDEGTSREENFDDHVTLLQDEKTDYGFHNALADVQEVGKKAKGQ